MRNSVRSTCNPSESDFEPPKYTAFLIAATDPFDREPKCSASSADLATTSSGGTTSSTCRPPSQRPRRASALGPRVRLSNSALWWPLPLWPRARDVLVIGVLDGLAGPLVELVPKSPEVSDRRCLRASPPRRVALIRTP